MWCKGSGGRWLRRLGQLRGSISKKVGGGGRGDSLHEDWLLLDFLTEDIYSDGMKKQGKVVDQDVDRLDKVDAEF